jgi:peptide/nickel transport system substrate-binding protein
MKPNVCRPALLAGSLVLLLAACSGGEGGEAASAADLVPEGDRYGGTAVIGGVGDLQSMNGLVSSDYNSNNVQRHMLFMTMVQYDDSLRLVPYLAESWDTVRVEGDSLELTFHVRRDVRWHDGTPTTAADVFFTYQRAIDPATAFPNISGFDLYSRRAQLVDPYTFTVRLRPHADFLDMWTQTTIMPEHILGPVRPAELLQSPFRYQPVGNGPFKFVRRVPAQEWVFEANPDFPEALGGRPYLDRIVYRVIPESTTLLTELLTGRVDFYLAPQPDMVDQLRATQGVELRNWKFRQYEYIAWNTRLPLFSDARVRRALTMAINRQEMVDALRHGFGEVGHSVVTPAHWAYDPDDRETLIPYDPEGARRLLAEAGWTPGPDSILRDSRGNQFRFQLMTNTESPNRRDAVEIVQAQLRPLGIVVEPRLIEYVTMVEVLQGTLSSAGERERDFDASVGGWVVFFRQDDTDILHCKRLNQPYQYVGFCNPRVDALIDTLGVTMDREQARPLWREYQRLIVQESPYTVLYYPERLGAIRTRLQGVVADIRGETITAGKWWLLPDQRTTP